MRILQVEGNRDLALAVERLLESAGSCCETVATGRECVEHARVEDFDMILLAFALPDMNGCEVLAKLDAMGVGAPALVRMRHQTLNGVYAETLKLIAAAAGRIKTKLTRLAEDDANSQRDSQRHKLLKAGQIVYRDARCVMDCTIVNVSASGACIQPADAFDDPGPFTLNIAHGPTRRCEVRWRRGGRIGVRFIK